MVAGQQEHRNRGAPQDVDRSAPGHPVDEVVVEDVPSNHHSGTATLLCDLQQGLDDAEPGLPVAGAGLLAEEPAVHAELPIGGVQEPEGAGLRRVAECGGVSHGNHSYQSSRTATVHVRTSVLIPQGEGVDR